MKKYTVGFIFNNSLDKVLLIHKRHPKWQNGKINGIGGKVEPGENSLDCVVREVQEESNLLTDKKLWIYAGSNEATDWRVDFYGYKYNGSLYDIQSKTDEIVEWFDTEKLPENIIPNLYWLIGLVINKFKENEYTSFKINY